MALAAVQDVLCGACERRGAVCELAEFVVRELEKVGGRGVRARRGERGEQLDKHVVLLIQRIAHRTKKVKRGRSPPS